MIKLSPHIRKYIFLLYCVCFNIKHISLVKKVNVRSIAVWVILISDGKFLVIFKLKIIVIFLSEISVHSGVYGSRLVKT